MLRVHRASRLELAGASIERNIRMSLSSSMVSRRTASSTTGAQQQAAPAPILGQVLQRGKNKREAQAQQVRSAVQRPLIVPQHTSFECGVFESLAHARQDFAERPGFDRVVVSHIERDIWSLGVIDGHGYSPLCADYLAESFPVCLKLLLQNEESTEEAHERRYCEALKRAFRICAEEWDASSHVQTSSTLKQSGAVALLGIIDGARNQIHLASAGDCRALVGTTHPHSAWRFVHTAHRTDNSKERSRVIQQGGRIKNVGGVPRVQGTLIPTRVFGDTAFKVDFMGRRRPYLDPEPDIATVQSKSVGEGGQDTRRCLIIATDGLWDGISEGAVADICRDQLRRGQNAGELAQVLGATAMQSTDDDVAIIALVW